MKRVAIALLVLLNVAGVARAEPAPDSVKAYLAQAAKDPDSVRYGEFSAAVNTAQGEQAVCGSINARNSYGGYTGSRLYVFTMFKNTVIGAEDVSRYSFIDSMRACMEYAATGQFPSAKR